MNVVGFAVIAAGVGVIGTLVSAGSFATPMRPRRPRGAETMSQDQRSPAMASAGIVSSAEQRKLVVPDQVEGFTSIPLEYVNP